MQALNETTRAEHGTVVGQSPKDGAGVLVDLIVLSGDQPLVTFIREASAGAHSLWPATSAEEAVEHLVCGRCGILLADLELLRGDVRLFFERIAAQFPGLVLIATGRREAQREISPLLTSGLVYRFLHKPVSPGRAQQFVAAATRRWSELNAREWPASATARRSAYRQLVRSIVRIGPRVAVAIAVVASLAMLAVLARDAWPKLQQHLARFTPAKIERPIAELPTPQPQTTHLSSTAATIAVPVPQTRAPEQRPAPVRLPAENVATPDVRELAAPNREAGSNIDGAVVDEALRALAAGRLLTSRTNALDLLRTAQRQNPPDPRLQIAATALGQRLLDEAVKAADTDVTAAQEWLTSAQTVDREFELGLAELARVAAHVRTVQERAARQRELLRSLQRAVERREAGDLIEPRGASAYDELMFARASMADEPALTAESERLALRLAEHADGALARGDIALALRLIEHATTLAPDTVELQVLRRKLLTSDMRAVAAQPVAANSLKRIVEVAPEFPLQARERGVEGWVEVEFTIEVDGSVSNLTVRAAEPLDVFNKAALDAVRRWRFEPITRGGTAVTQRAYLRLNFALR